MSWFQEIPITFLERSDTVGEDAHLLIYRVTQMHQFTMIWRPVRVSNPCRRQDLKHSGVYD